jgi:uncharacterized protein (DUF885 family)
LPEKENLLENVKADWKTYAWRALGGGIGIYAMQLLAEMGHFPIALVPFATYSARSSRASRLLPKLHRWVRLVLSS